MQLFFRNAGLTVVGAGYLAANGRCRVSVGAKVRCFQNRSLEGVRTIGITLLRTGYVAIANFDRGTRAK